MNGKAAAKAGTRPRGEPKEGAAVNRREAEAAVAALRKQIDALDFEFVGVGVGVAQALDCLRKALTEIRVCLDRREYEKASSTLAYGPVTSNFIFLQRTLAGLHDACMRKVSLVGDVAMKLRCPYEDALPYVDAMMPTQRPLTDKERRAARKALPGLKARVRAMARTRSAKSG